MEISENIITKLFDTLRKSIDDNKDVLDKSVNFQITNINYLKPKIEKTEENTKKNLGILKKLSGRVNTMILVVIIAFTLLIPIYYIARFFESIIK